VIIDIFSRYVVGWILSPAETDELAQAFIAGTLARHGIERRQLTIHADRRTSMTSKPVAQLLVDLGVARSHSRPHVSNDNPYSEAQFKTLKYCPAFPARFRHRRPTPPAAHRRLDQANPAPKHSSNPHEKVFHRP
jgi:putative transposase